MLQRAASNAYSWWWASHIRTKQSKWLEQSLQDMEEKVTAVLKLIEEDGDSFAKRAEMYYKKRPEIIHFVEESYRAFRALAERYDLMSKELQKANSTLASAFPDQFQFAMDDDDDGPPGIPKKSMGNLKQNPNIPDVPKQFPARKIRAIMALTSKNNNRHPPKTVGGRSANKPVNVPRSGISKEQALEEIDKLQKAILTKQTEKEFMKSSYASGLAKYWEIEHEITEMQEKVSKFQDEFGIGKDIEDNEARTLMLEAALKSCQDTLAQLQEKNEKSAAEAREERQKIKDARERLLSFKGEVLGVDQISQIEPVSEEGEELPKGEEDWVRFDDRVEGSSQAKELEMLRHKIKEHFEVDSALSVSEMADKIDELVSKVINLENAVSSQTAIIQRLRAETDELHMHIQNLEDDKANLIDGKNSLNDKLREMEDRLKRLQELEHSVESRNSHLQVQFIDASCSLNEISQQLPIVKLDEETKQTDSEQEVIAIAELSSSPEESAKKNDVSKDNQAEEDASQSISHQKELHHLPKELQDPERVEELRDSSPSATGDVSVQEEGHSRNKQPTEPTSTFQAVQPEDNPKQEEDEPNWQQLFVNGLEGKEKLLLNEYTSILRNYKEVKKKLGEVENKSENSLMELTELKIENAKKDEEIQSLRQKLILLQKKLEEIKNLKEIKEDNNSDPQVTTPEKDDDIINFIVEEPRTLSPVEEKLRADIDVILEENLDFWMRFSASFSEVQKFQSEIEDLQKELAKIEKEKKKEGSSVADRSLKSDARPIYKHLKEIQTELTVWLEKSVELKDELGCRFSQLCQIQEDITRALSDGALDEDMKFTSFQAAKFQGEVLNMQQENKKVEDELQACVDHVTNLQLEAERSITRLNEELGISGSKSQSINQTENAGSRNRIPLRAFIFGVKPKKQKQSILSNMHPTWHKKYQHLKSGQL